MDLTITGGILEAKKIASMGEAHYAQIAPHLYGGPIGGAANIQLDVCSPNFLIQEGIHTWDGFPRRYSQGAVAVGRRVHHSVNETRTRYRIER